MKLRFLPALSIMLLAASCTSKSEKTYDTWGVYGGNKENNHYSSLAQIDTNNVTQLQVAWEYHTHDSDKATQIQVNPIVIDNILYGVSPKLKLFALDAATGAQKWIYDPSADSAQLKAFGNYYFMMNVCRGVAFYTDGKEDKRIFYGAGPRLYC